MKIFEINIVLGVFNLIPAHPLDGAKIWRAILSKFFIYKKAHKIIMMTSFCMSVFIIIIGSLLMFENITSINLVFIGILMIFTSYSIKERTMYIVLDQIISKNKRFKEIRYIENKDISVYWKEDFIKLLSMIERNKFNTFYILNDKMEYLYDLREDEVVEILKTNGNMSLEDYYNNVLK
ncbi:site-2 protease family protein [uncultured Clostridium sp.]|uniref:site-2 protease family protein n=1 Tax=uncultured Clostridium sp. TaxID=59620 RepID=UPI002607DC38|nr:site-2 protease family protein [uncultured Clostridium sp.]